jgi:hypothetical protein
MERLPLFEMRDRPHAAAPVCAVDLTSTFAPARYTVNDTFVGQANDMNPLRYAVSLSDGPNNLMKKRRFIDG